MPSIEAMKKFGSSLRLCDRLLLILIATSVVLRLFLINQDISVILNKFLSDDAYYYYSLAKNIVNGHGIVFNYGIPTNGFHPLYVLILLPFFELLYPLGVNLPIYASLFILTIFSAGTSVFLYLIVSKLLNKEAGLLAAFIWLFNPYVLSKSLMGLEIPIQLFFISLLTYFILDREDRVQFSVREATITGFLIGIIFWSRMDGIFVGIGVIGALAIRKLFRHRKLTVANLRTFYPDLAIIILIASLTVLPWIVWNLVEMNRIIPVSGEALRMKRLISSSCPNLVIGSIYGTGVFVANFITGLKLTVHGQGYLVVFLALIVPFMVLMVKKDDLVRKLFSRLDFLVISSVLYYAFYWFYELGFRSWYWLYTGFLVTIVFSTMAIKVIQNIEVKKFRQSVYILLICILVPAFILGGIRQYRVGHACAAKLHWEIANYLESNISPDETIGSFNTGIYQYYTKNHDVINLDGVMNPEAYQALKDGNIEGYILRKNIAYIVDSPSYIYVEKLDRSILSLEPIKTFEIRCYSWGKEIQICELFKVTPAKDTEAE